MRVGTFTSYDSKYLGRYSDTFEEVEKGLLLEGTAQVLVLMTNYVRDVPLGDVSPMAVISWRIVTMPRISRGGKHSAFRSRFGTAACHSVLQSTAPGSPGIISRCKAP